MFAEGDKINGNKQNHEAASVEGLISRVDSLHCEFAPWS